ncbi:unnamed protein product, partial [Ilex paraguariensis]
SDCLYNAGWTEDIRKVIDHLHCQYPEAPLFLVGTSIGANILAFVVLLHVAMIANMGLKAPDYGSTPSCFIFSDFISCQQVWNDTQPRDNQAIVPLLLFYMSHFQRDSEYAPASFLFTFFSRISWTLFSGHNFEHNASQVKFLGEDGVNIPVIGAAAICSPWDLLVDNGSSDWACPPTYDKFLKIPVCLKVILISEDMVAIMLCMVDICDKIPSSAMATDDDVLYLFSCGMMAASGSVYATILEKVTRSYALKLIGDRFISRRLVQKFYGKALTTGLKGYAQLHQPIFSRLADWEGIEKSCSVRDFDNYATRLVGKFETVDTYYRRCSSAGFVGNVMVPLLCISAIDDPVCTREAIPWDECRANQNIILAATQHGGHLAFFEGITAKSLWWVRAVDEFLSVLHRSPLIHRKKEMQISSPGGPLESSIDQAPYVNFRDDGMVTALGNEPTINIEDSQNECIVQKENGEDTSSNTQGGDHLTREKPHMTSELEQALGQDVKETIVPVKKGVDQLCRQSRKSMWLLAYIAIVTTWPVVGSALLLFFKKKFRDVLPEMLKRR